MTGRHFDAGDGAHLMDALGWLLESRHLDLEVKDHFWHIADGAPCDCEETGRVEARDGRDGTEKGGMTWIKTFGQVALLCDDCIAPAEQLTEELEGEETHHGASSRLWAAAVRDGWRSAQMGVLHSCPEHSGEEPW